MARRLKVLTAIIVVGISWLFGSCDPVDDSVIPSMPVYIRIENAGMWNVYGVAGFGQWRYFIRFESTLEPPGFPYGSSTYTGYGGVLLISGMDPFSPEVPVPLAYDLSCPVERSQTIRVAVDPENLDAVCPVCHSHYDVTTRGGAPLSGPAATGKRKYGLQRYRCLSTSMGGYLITN